MTPAKISRIDQRVNQPVFRIMRRVVAGLLIGVVTGSASAGGVRLSPSNVPTPYLEECGSCHLPYPPGLLPARSWQAIMATLDKHFGSDASIDADVAQSISRWLDEHAGTYKRVTGRPPDDRITRSAWFERKHRKIDRGVWALPSVKSPAQCSACHGRAEQGVFDDDDMRMPAGLTQRQMRAWYD